MLQLQSLLFRVDEFFIDFIPEFLGRYCNSKHSSVLHSCQINSIVDRSDCRMLACCGFLIRNHAIYKLGRFGCIGGKFHVQLRVCLGLGECGGKLLRLDESLTIGTLLTIRLKDKVFKHLYNGRHILSRNNSANHIAETAGRTHLHLKSFGFRDVKPEIFSALKAVIVGISDCLFNHAKFLLSNKKNTKPPAYLNTALYLFLNLLFLMLNRRGSSE
nr:MAG TPA: hypothetical protein [Caudoviricetes sp.]